MKNKKLILLTLLLIVSLLVSCQKAPETKDEVSSSPVEEATKEAVNISALKGPTAMGLVNLFDSQDKNEASNDYNYTILASPEEAVAKFAAGEVDILALPSNLGATLYNKTEGKLKVAAINTLGVLYIASHEDISNISELKGKTIITSGKGSSPEFALRYVLENKGLNPDTDVVIEYKSEHTEVLASLNANPEAVVMLPEPFLTVATTKDPSLKINLSLSELWDEISKEKSIDSKLIMGIVVIRDTLLEEKPEVVEKFLKDYEESVKLTKENPEETAALIGKYDIVPEAVALQSLERCNIVFIQGEEMKSALSEYLTTLFEQNPQSVGGSLPNEDFYITK